MGLVKNDRKAQPFRLTPSEHVLVDLPEKECSSCQLQGFKT